MIVRILAFYNWILFIPLTDFFSKLTRMTVSLIVLGYIGLIFTYIYAIYFSYCYRDHQFREINSARKKVSLFNYLYLSLHFSLIIMSNNSVSSLVLTVVYHIMMLILIVEYFKMFPFSNLSMSRLYLISLLVCEGNSIIFLATLQFKLFSKDITPVYCLVISFFLGYLAWKIFDEFFLHLIRETDSIDKRFQASEKS